MQTPGELVVENNQLDNYKILGWQKSSFRFFCNILWKNLNDLFGQPNITTIGEYWSWVPPLISNHISNHLCLISLANMFKFRYKTSVYSFQLHLSYPVLIYPMLTGIWMLNCPHLIHILRKIFPHSTMWRTLYNLPQSR